MNPTAQFYAQPSYRGGINFPVYTGSRRQAGGSVFGVVKRAVVPILKTAGKEAGKSALSFAGDVMSDVISGRNWKQSMKHRGKERASEFIRNSAKRFLTDEEPVPSAKRTRVQSRNRSSSMKSRMGRRSNFNKMPRRVTKAGRKVSRQFQRRLPKRAVARLAKKSGISKFAGKAVGRIGKKAISKVGKSLLSTLGKSAAKLF